MIFGFIVLLSSLVRVADLTKCLFLNDEQFMVRHSLIDMNHVELNYYPFMISLNKCTGSCNILSPKICVSKESKDINVKAFNMLTNKDEVKTMPEQFSCDCKCKFNITTCNSNRKWNDRTCQCKCKLYLTCKNDFSWNPSTCLCENSKYLKSIAGTTVTECDEIIIVWDNLSTKNTNTIATNVTSTASINWHNKKVRHCYISHDFISDHINIDNYYYWLSLCKTKKV